MSTKCTNDQPGSDCGSERYGMEPDMRLGDICVMCASWECERCHLPIDLDEEVQIKDGQGFRVVCGPCHLETDILHGVSVYEVTASSHYWPHEITAEIKSENGYTYSKGLGAVIAQVPRDWKWVPSAIKWAVKVTE